MNHFAEPRTTAAASLLALALLGCPSATPDGAVGPEGPDADKLDTEMRHEPCDLTASSAKRIDANGDGRPDLVKVMDGGREECRAVDINMDGVIDVFVYFDKAGRERRRESGFDRDAQPDEISHYENGTLVRKERETNNDKKIDTWDYFQGARLVKELRDSSGDGYIDQWWTFNRPTQPKCAVVIIDIDGDGKPDSESQIDICADKDATTAQAQPAPKPKQEPPEQSPPDGEEPKPEEKPAEEAYD